MLSFFLLKIKKNQFHKNYRNLPLLILLLLGSFSIIYSQNKIVDNLATQITNLSEQHISDIVYLQTSKSIYETEEDLWFKGYVLDAQLLLPSLKSKIFFVQLIEDKTDKSVWEEKYEIENGFVNGHLYLNDSLQTGSYTLAAYSSHSFYNDTKEFHALRKLQILKNIKRKPRQQFATKDSIFNFTIFPEGGDLVSGIQNKVAFKAENSKGFPIDISGTLYENNTPITEFKSTHAGMGSFLFTPNPNNNYHIQLTEPEKDNIYNLPKILSSGKTLQLLNINKNHAFFKVSQSSDLTEKPIYLRIQSRGIVYNIAMGTLNEELLIKIPLKDIPQGIAEVTLFDENAVPVAERLIYVNPQQKLNIKTVLNKSEYLTREKAVLKIKVTDQNNEPVVAHLGLSVFDEIYNNKLDTKNILTHYYLSTQIKGNIYNPAYYFNEDNKDRHEALNLLLLTQGWRRYVWNEANLKGHNEHFQHLLSDSIVGHIRLENPNKKPDQQGQKIVMAYTPDSLRGKDMIMTNSKGIFNIDYTHLKMAEKGYLYIKPMTPVKPKYVIDIKDVSFENINTHRQNLTLKYPLTKQEKEEQKEDSIDNFILPDNINKLEEIVLSTKKKQIFRDKYLGTLDSLLKFDIRDYVCSYGNLNCINHPEDYNRKPIEGETYLAEDRISKITYRTKKYTEEEILKKFNLKMLKGNYGKRELYQPVYNEETINDPFPDYRNTLFWKPDIITNEQGEAVIEFYCSDINTGFMGIIEGVNGTGLVGNENFKFKVIKN
ncbi:hypothetical protein ACGK9U_13230 [Mariniflexile sp. HNIBRBA6329]|uniref:hypothetical protein n=1 Tax=Mariniflexile sp. HNIBRBA6329 TaxID=3373088 RepID=UPI003744B9F7